jgi:hypothetical protein
LWFLYLKNVRCWSSGRDGCWMKTWVASMITRVVEYYSLRWRVISTGISHSEYWSIPRQTTNDNFAASFD